MRVWYKTLIQPKMHTPRLVLDQSFDEHSKTMGGYDCAGYGSAEQFFQAYLLSSPRHLCYDKFLSTHLPRQAHILSIASGRAVNEMRLLAEGYNVVCSDLEPVCFRHARQIFPGYRFMKWDALVDPLPKEQFDAVICLSFVYLLDVERLGFFFRRVSQLLMPRGVFILDVPASPDTKWGNFLHEVFLPLEARATCGMLNVCNHLHGKGSLIVHKKHHGYRYGDGEILALAAREGFDAETVEHMDFETEWSRSYLYRYGLRRIPLIRSGLLALGRLIPYVRLFLLRAGSR